MFDDLTTESWAFLMPAIGVVSLGASWAIDAILGKRGFGLFKTLIIAEGGAYLGLQLTDWAIRQHKIPPMYQSPHIYAFGSIITATLLFLVASIVRRLVRKA